MMRFSIRLFVPTVACCVFAGCESTSQRDTGPYDAEYELRAHDPAYPDSVLAAVTHGDSWSDGTRTAGSRRVDDHVDNRIRRDRLHDDADVAHRDRLDRRDPALETREDVRDRGFAEASSRRDAMLSARRATAVLTPVGGSRVEGTLTFEPSGDGVRVHGRITGLTPGKHGFHVHEYGDLADRDEGKTAGEHFAPGGTQHGRPDAEHRHAGDLGNIVADENGVANVDMVDRMLRLDGPNSILGRSIVVHADEDKFTQPSGDSGPRVAIGVIGVAGDAKPSNRPADRDRSTERATDPGRR